MRQASAHIDTTPLVWTRRQFTQSAAVSALIVATYEQAYALSLGDLTQKDAAAGLKAALEKGALAAVGILGRPDGFLGNDKVRIALPGFLEDAGKILSKLGQNRRIEELVTSMNRGAEAAVPFSKELLRSAVRSMNVVDAKNILAGGDTSVTAFFQGKTREPLEGKFLPIVNKATEKVGLAQKYNDFGAKATALGLVKKEDANIQQYVTTRALDGLYLVIGEQERLIRADPVGTGSAILKKVFGILKG